MIFYGLVQQVLPIVFFEQAFVKKIFSTFLIATLQFLDFSFSNIGFLSEEGVYYYCKTALTVH